MPPENDVARGAAPCRSCRRCDASRHTSGHRRWETWQCDPRGGTADRKPTSTRSRARHQRSAVARLPCIYRPRPDLPAHFAEWAPRRAQAMTWSLNRRNSAQAAARPAEAAPARGRPSRGAYLGVTGVPSAPPPVRRVDEGRGHHDVPPPPTPAYPRSPHFRYHSSSMKPQRGVSASGEGATTAARRASVQSSGGSRAASRAGSERPLETQWPGSWLKGYNHGCGYTSSCWTRNGTPPATRSVPVCHSLPPLHHARTTARQHARQHTRTHAPVAQRRCTGQEAPAPASTASATAAGRQLSKWRRSRSGMDAPCTAATAASCRVITALSTGRSDCTDQEGAGARSVHNQARAQ